MRTVTLKAILTHPEISKYLRRSGLQHAINVSYHAFKLSLKYNVDPDLATKAGLLHDIGHYNWYTNGKWNFQMYRENDIHAIKGSARAHEYLIELGEEASRAKQIAIAILLHTDSYLPSDLNVRTPLQEITRLADECDEEPNGNHHYRKMTIESAYKKIILLDHKVDMALRQHQGLA